MESLRLLLYPLGLFGSFLFGLRIFVQWMASEKKKESYAPRIFWMISIAANLVMACHGLIQLQFPVCAIQATNGLIAWRNLNLMRKHPLALSKVLWFEGIALCLILTLFLVQNFLLHSSAWMRPPALPWCAYQENHVSPLWHFLGCCGMLLFASRYWIQWWTAERKKKSHLGISFWWMSLIGALLSTVYFFRLNDPVQYVGYGVGLIPYIRNLMLFRKKTLFFKA